MIQPGKLATVRFGPRGPQVPRLGFGAIPIQSVSHAEAVDVAAYAYERGVRFFDTARAYTTSEERLGEALQGVRPDVFIVSKSGARERDALARDLDVSLANLRTGYVDLFLFHGVSRDDDLDRILAPGGILEFMREQEREGRVRSVGLSSHEAGVATRAVRTGEFAAIEFPFNYLEDQCLAELLPTSREKGVPFIAMKPLAGGVLSSPAAALKWLAATAVEVIIPGLCSRREVDEAMAAFLAVQEEGEAALTAKERRAIERDRLELDRSFCRRCGYCEPCPQGVPIGFVLGAELFFRRSGWNRLEGRLLEMLRRGLECRQCGECEQRCPYGLPLAEMIRPTTTAMLARAEEVLAARPRTV